jgi:hypothetical protein
MFRKLGWVAVGVGAFFVASICVSLGGMVVSALIPGPSKDKPGKLEADPQQAAKSEWLQQLEGGGPTASKEAKETPEAEAPKEQQPAPETAVFQQADPTPAAAPPAPTVGPGNFESPTPYLPPPATQSGPGNM